mgnify:FL=1
MIQTVKVFCKNNNQYYDVPMGTSLVEILKTTGIEKPFLIVNCKVNNKTESLNYQVYQPKNIEYIDISESSGMRTYVRSLCFILAKAVSNVFPQAQMSIEHPIAKGYYGVIKGKKSLTESDIAKIKLEIDRLIAEDLPFEALEAETKEVVELFRQHYFEDKALLLETSDMLYSKYYRLGNYVDYFYG